MINVVEMKLVKIVDMELRKSDKQFLLNIKLDIGDSYVYVRDIVIAHMDNILNSVKIEQDDLTGDCMISRLLKNNLWVLDNTIVHEQKPKEMTLEEIEKALGYPVKIVKENNE